MNEQYERNERLLEVAGKIKDEDILIYTVQFANGSGSLASLMKNTATKPDAPFYNYAPSSDDLKASFRAVANNLSTLRLAK
ncbi:MAG: hypothetical protein AAGA36_14975, partial [Pseudomonadota bacterium]